jgi:hypothetical protein
LKEILASVEAAVPIEARHKHGTVVKGHASDCCPRNPRQHKGEEVYTILSIDSHENVGTVSYMNWALVRQNGERTDKSQRSATKILLDRIQHPLTILGPDSPSGPCPAHLEKRENTFDKMSAKGYVAVPIQLL